MRLAVISFTRQGSRCNARVVSGLLALGESCCGYVQERFRDKGENIRGLQPIRCSLSEWTKARFLDCDGLVFIGAAGIAVRAIAPYLQDKRTDPAVIVVDEQGTWVISLLSGHVGGGNRLTGTVAGILGAAPVITTATDINNKTAIDVLAGDAGLRISDWELAKQVSTELLEDNPVGFFSDFSWPEAIPAGFTQNQSCALVVWISARIAPTPADFITLYLLPESRILRLVPGVYRVGIGCRKGTPKAVLAAAVTRVMAEHNLAVEGIVSLGSIDLKKQEPGLLALAAEWQIDFITYSQEELNALAGIFSSSSFVKQITGTDNVCERAAIAMAGGGGELLVRKQVLDGVTVAVAHTVKHKESIWQRS